MGIFTILWHTCHHVVTFPEFICWRLRLETRISKPVQSLAVASKLLGHMADSVTCRCIPDPLTFQHASMKSLGVGWEWGYITSILLGGLTVWTKSNYSSITSVKPNIQIMGKLYFEGRGSKVRRWIIYLYGIHVHIGYLPFQQHHCCSPLHWKQSRCKLHQCLLHY